MENKDLILLYIRNGKETIFPVKDVAHAIRLADAISESDLLDDSVDYNIFDLCYSRKSKFGYVIGDYWKSDRGESFDEYWNIHLLT